MNQIPGSEHHQQAEEYFHGDKSINFSWGVKIPLRDGVLLNATLYKPTEDQPVPAIFTLTPYIADSYHERAYYFAQNGYAFLLVDCRGRGNSQGIFEPNLNEGPDGFDIVDWLANQPWCDGQVTMWGGSYSGFDQWATLKEFPSPLKTIVPVASAQMGVDFPFFGNIFYSYGIRWLALVSGLTANTNIFNEEKYWKDVYRQMYMNHHSFRELDQLAGVPSTYFQTWLEHPKQEPYWDKLKLTNKDYFRIDIPILTITGHYDGDQPGALAFYRQHMQNGSESVRAKHYLVIGPWDHGGTRTPKAEFGGVKFADASLLDMNQLHKDWYDWVMKDGEKPEFLQDRVAYYVTGLEQWKYASSLEEIPNQQIRLYLNSTEGQANDPYHSGYLDADLPVTSKPDQYTYDPLDTRPGELERQPRQDYLVNQSHDINLFGSGLIYHSAPFESDIEVSGFIKLVAWIEMDVPDTDFQIRISEISPDGSYMWLTDTVLRARYRESLRQEKLIIPGEINRYVFDGFYFTSRLVRKGCRIRLVIKANNTISWQKNYNSGGVVADETAADAKTALVKLHHDSDHPSYLELPVVVSEAKK